MPDLGTYPALTGSEKQVAWARSLRDARMNEATAMLEHFTGRARTAQAEGKITSERAERARARNEALLRALMAETDAAWWIETRGLEPEQVFKQIARRCGI